MDKRLQKIALIELIVFLALWQILAVSKIIPEYLSNPVVVLGNLWEMAKTGELFLNAGVSLRRSLLGFVLVAVIGVFLGVAAGYFKSVGRFFDPIISFFNPIPKIALLPLLIVWFGISDTTRVLIIFMTAFFPAFITAQDGVRSVKKVFIWAGENMGANSWQILTKIVFPASLPKIFDGLRISLGLTFVMLFSSEMIGSSNGTGLGFLILKADVAGRTDIMLSSVLMIALLGYIFDRILLLVRKRLLWWNER